MSSDARRTLWVGALTGVFAIAILSSFEGLLWNQDALYLLNLGVLVWAAAGAGASEPSRRRSLAMILNLFALTMYAGRTDADVNLGVRNWLGLHENWVSRVLFGANYLAHLWIAILAYRATPRGQRHPIRRLLATPGIVLLLGVSYLSMLFSGRPLEEAEAIDPSFVERYTVSPTLVYEKWGFDSGGTGGLDCRVYRIRTMGLVARYQQIDPDHDAPAPIAGGCGW